MMFKLPLHLFLALLGRERDGSPLSTTAQPLGLLYFTSKEIFLPWPLPGTVTPLKYRQLPHRVLQLTSSAAFNLRAS